MDPNQNEFVRTVRKMDNEEENNQIPKADNNKTCMDKKKIIIISIVASVLVIVLVVVLCVTLIKKKKKIPEINEESYITATYNSQKGVPLKLFNPSRMGLSDQNYTIQEINTNKTRRLQELNIRDGTIIPEITGTIQIKISFNESLITLDFMFEGCTDLIKVSLSNLNSTSITSMIYTFTGCSNLETVDFTSFSSSKVEKMDFLFGGCTNLVNIKGFEKLDTSSLQKTAGMFLECKHLNFVNLSAFKLNDISEQNGMFIDNPSLETLDLGNTRDINGLFSSTENFKVTIITSSNEVNSSGLSGEFTRISREENEQLNCTLKNWTEFILKFSSFISIDSEEELYELKNEIENYYFSEEVYKLYNLFIEIDCNNNSVFIFNNSSECEQEKRLIKDFLNQYERCTECDDEEGRRSYCKKCSKGYYVPKGIDISPTKCKRCDEGCLECIPDNETDKSICLRCQENDVDYYDEYYDDQDYEYDDDYEGRFKLYKLYNGKCIKRCQKECKSCNEEDGKYDQCSECHEGYYLIINDDKAECKKIEIDNCIQAIVENDMVKCTNCTNGYIIHNGQCVKACEVSYWGSSCASCNQTYEFRENCASCHSGYYLFTEGNKTYCRNCYETSNKNCKDCEYFSGEINCTSCYSDYFLADGKCIDSCRNCLNCVYRTGRYSCDTCRENYFLKESEEGKYCESCSDGCKYCINNYNCTQCMEGYKLINGRCELYCDIGSYSNCKSCDFNNKGKCKDCNQGYYLPNNSLVDQSTCSYCGSHCMSCYGDSINPICTQCYYGYELSNNECIRQCNLGNYWDYCKTCDTLITENCGSCHEGYYLAKDYKRYCSYCGYGIKTCHQDDNYNIIVDECYSDYVLVRNSCQEKCVSNSYWSSCLVCNEEADKLDQCKQCKEGYYLPTDYENQYCYYCPYNCKSCEGTSYEPKCTECYDGYKLSGGKCLQDCITGNNYLCKSCNSEPGKIDRCLDCNDRYYLPNDNYYQSQCSSCPNNCKNCTDIDHYTPDCTKCDDGYYLAQAEQEQYYYYYDPIYYHICLPCNIPGCSRYKSNSNICICTQCNTPTSGQMKYGDTNNEFISCYGGCEIGELEKCKSCGSVSGECGECNDGYTLNSNGKCIGDFHMFAKYRTTEENEYVQLMSATTIIRMTINNTLIPNPKYYYTFPLPGEHSIYVKFSSSISFMDLFYNIIHLTYIEFLPKAKNFYIYYMNDCFCGCVNLEYADLSNLDLTNNRCFMNFFKGDKKLKEVKFPAESFSNIYWYYRMFYECESLTSVDMSKVHNSNGEYFYEMFYGCTKLKSINLGGFNKVYNGYYNYDMFVNVPKDADITIHDNFYQGISKQLGSFNNKKINN